jgi:hypothetical protein
MPVNIIQHHLVFHISDVNVASQLEVGCEAVAYPWLTKDVVWSSWVFLDLAPQVADVHPQQMPFVIVGSAPNLS